MFTKKYEPKSLNEIIGQSKAVSQLLMFYKSFNQGGRKALLIFGPSGCGKTSMVYALAKQENAELIDVNASDRRNKDSILEILRPASRQKSIFGGNKIILIDEVDALSGRKDRGAASALVDIIKETSFPIILTANDGWSDKLKKVRKYCNMLELNKLTENDVFNILLKICDEEKIKYEESALKKLALSVDGDARAAINDLEVMSVEGKLDSETLFLWGREKDENIFNVLKLIFKSRSSDVLSNAVFNLSLVPEDILLWVEENVGKEYHGQALKNAYDLLSSSDIFLSRIRRWQHWRFLVYASYLSSTGVQQIKDKVNPKFIKHTQPEFFLNLWKLAAKRKKYKGLAEQFSDKLHASARVLQKDFAPYFNFIEQNNKQMFKELMDSLSF